MSMSVHAANAKVVSSTPPRAFGLMCDLFQAAASPLVTASLVVLVAVTCKGNQFKLFNSLDIAKMTQAKPKAKRRRFVVHGTSPMQKKSSEHGG